MHTCIPRCLHYVRIRQLHQRESIKIVQLMVSLARFVSSYTGIKSSGVDPLVVCTSMMPKQDGMHLYVCPNFLLMHNHTLDTTYNRNNVG